MRRMIEQFETRPARGRRRVSRGFTLIEILVTAALLTIAMAAVIQIFTITSDAAAKTSANSDVVRKAAAVREAITAELSRMAPGFLVIQSPEPTPVRSEIDGDLRFMRLRHDRLVFLTHGEVDAYQSFTDPTRGGPFAPGVRKTASSPEALVYFGPGTPLIDGAAAPVDDTLNPFSQTLSASQWIFQHRAILLIDKLNPGSNPTWLPPVMNNVVSAGGMLDHGNLLTNLVTGSMDAIRSDTTANGLRATAQTFISLIQRKPLDGTDLLSASPSIESLWTPSVAPAQVSLENVTLTNYYTRAGSNFIPGLADFRIEWTDGGVDVGADNTLNTADDHTRWFGLRPDPNSVITNTDIDNMLADNAPALPYVASRRQDYVNDTTYEAAGVFGIAAGTQNKVEWSRNGAASGLDSAYRAIWRPETWDHRPKALRFTYRIYDPDNRLKQSEDIDLNENGDFDPDDASAFVDNDRRQLTRYGRTFSFVVPLP